MKACSSLRLTPCAEMTDQQAELEQCPHPAPPLWEDWGWATYLYFIPPPTNMGVGDRSNQHSSHMDGQLASTHHLPALYIYKFTAVP